METIDAGADKSRRKGHRHFVSRRSAASGVALVLALLAAAFAIWVALLLAAPVGTMSGNRLYWVGAGTRPVPPHGISGEFRGSPTGRGVHRQTVRLGDLIYEFSWTHR